MTPYQSSDDRFYGSADNGALTVLSDPRRYVIKPDLRKIYSRLFPRLVGSNEGNSALRWKPSVKAGQWRKTLPRPRQLVNEYQPK